MFYASFKTGDADGRDRLGRYYNYPSPDGFEATYAGAGHWRSSPIDTSEIKSFDDDAGNDAVSVGAQERY